jgi:uncharacterized protein (UPF0332 family)
MNEKEAYLKIAERTLDSSEKLLNEGLKPQVFILTMLLNH